MRSRENVLYLDEFLTLDNNLSNMSLDSQETYEIGNIHELEEYRLEKFVRNETISPRFAVFDTCNVDSTHTGDIGDIAYAESVYIKRNEASKVNDIYKPKKTRGCGNLREGYCSDCNLWLRLKTSSYWYHMNYKHGINSKGVKYPEPETRHSEHGVQGFCDICNKWIALGHKKSKRSIRFGWFRHWQKSHSTNKTV